MLNTDSVTSIKIDDGTIVNADINDSAAIAMSKLALSITNSEINASAAIAGTKISPNFGSQNTTTTGIGAFGELQVTSTAPKITFFDSDTNPDFEIRNLHGVLHFKDVSSTAVRMQINTDGHVDILGNLDVGAGLDVTGAITGTAGLSVEGATVFNDAGTDVDFRIEGNGEVNLLFVDASADKIGIGTSSPSGLLSLQANNPNIRFDDSDTNNNGEITLDNTQLRIEVDEDEAVDNSAIKFRIDNSDKAIIDSSGNVGIGASSPAGKLHISSGTSGDCELVIEADTDNNDENDNARIVFRQDGGSAQSSIGTQSNELVLANSVSTSGGIVFKTGTTSPHTNATERMRIHPGTFQVQIGGTTLINSNPYLTLGQSANSQGNVFHLVNNGTADLKQVFISANKNSRHVGIDVSADNFFIGRDSSVTDFVIDNSGKVGIGTSTPGSKVHVADTNPVLGTFHRSDGSSSGDQARISIGALANNPPYQRGVNIIAEYKNTGHDFVVACSPNDASGPTEKIRVFAGGGLTFNGDTAAANALDDYEEGNLSWQLRKHNTPSLGTDNGSNG